MIPEASSIPISPVHTVAKRQQEQRRESTRDFAGVAVGAGAGALLWIAVLSLLRTSA